MEYDLRKQKRLGPAPIASFEKSFEDNVASSNTGTPELSRQDAVNVQAAESDRSNMELDLTGGGGPRATTIISTVNMPSGSSSTKPRRHNQHEPSNSSDNTSKRPPPLQPVNVSVHVQQSSQLQTTLITTGGTQEVHFSGITTLAVTTPSTPRIDISRASSSSHHEDSRDSSPDNVFEQVGTGTLQESIGLGFREEGALDLRSSTEELYFMDPEQKKEEQEKMQQARKSPVIFKFDEHQTYLQQHQRKDSASSEVAALLCISGRTSRISSVGSQGSAISRLSAVSGISRSPSPHKMLLETSFCGPKPLENVVDGSIVSTVEPPTAEALEQVLLSRKHDPTQAVFAEGIKIEGSPKKSLTNGEAQRRRPEIKELPKTTKPTTSARPIGKKVPIPTVGVRKDGSKRVIGALPSGAEYIRINLKPDYLYEDKGVAPNERIIEMSKDLGGPSERKKPATLSLGRDINAIEQRLTPSSSPKPARHQILARETGGSRSPSPATVTISRKSSFCSLFKAKDSPDSPRDQSRSRSKSRDRSTPQSQSGTPSKQKSVLAIFKPRRSVSKSKCSSPIDHDAMSTTPLEGISQVEFKFKSEPSGSDQNRSRPSSRLRYYDTPLDGKSIHIPLHTPPEEKQDRKFPPTSSEAKEPEPPPPSASGSSGSSHITSGPTPPASATLPPRISETPPPRPIEDKPPALPQKAPKLAQLEKAQRIVNLDAIHSVLSDDSSERDRTWSLEVHRHSSQESQETASGESTNSTATQRRISKPSLSDVVESSSIENGTPPAPVEPIKEQPAQKEIVSNHHNIPISKEKKRLLFSTKIGSGSQEQVFITQFSLSKTESLTSQLSEQQSTPGSPSSDGKHLHRTDTVIRRTDDSQNKQAECPPAPSASPAPHVKRKSSTEDSSKPTVVGVIEKKDSSDEYKRKSKTSDEEDQHRKPLPAAVVMRKKEHSAESKRKSKSASEEDDSTNRHSRYIESFDIKRGLPDLKSQSRHSSDSSIKERDSRTSSREDQDANTPLAAPKLPPKSSMSLKGKADRLSTMTDDLAESSESERDSEMDPNRIKRHLPRHIGAVEDHESTGLVSQDSFEDELPYVPTTLPEERAFGVPLIPMKDRVNMEVKTCPVDRPRSTTPMNPACLEEYCGIAINDDAEHVPTRGEKLRISLPRKDSLKERSQRTKSPRRVSNSSGKTWFEFAEQGLGRTTVASVTTPTKSTTSNLTDEEPPPPLPPRKPTNTGQWIDFENIPEKRKPPKRITALPKDSSLDFVARTPNSQSVQYNYVKPEECQCECHEVERESHKSSIVNVDLLQQGEDLQPLLDPDSHEGIEPSDSSVEYSYENEEAPFQNHLPAGQDRSSSSAHSEPQYLADVRPMHGESTPTRSSNSRRRKSGDYQKP